MNGQHFQTSIKTPSGNPLEDFILQNGRYANFTKETFFIRYISKYSFRSCLDKLNAWQAPGLVFVPDLSSQPPIAALGKYTELYNNGNLRFPFCFQNRLWQEALEQGFGDVLALFRAARGRSEDSIIRNFSIKLLYLIDTYFPRLFTETAKMNRFPKFACTGALKLPEYLFLCLLFRLGCDVLCLSPAADLSLSDPKLLELSQKIEEAPPQSAPNPPQPAPDQTPAGGRPTISMERIRRADRQPAPPRVTPAPAPTVPTVPTASRPTPAPRNTASAREPLEFEDLAKFAASVTMLKVFDQNDQCFKTGSGVIINEKGYVLTNFHVVSGGAYYGILLEEETDVFYTNELIKYHPDYDLAVLRMEKHRQPIPISAGAKPLVRGQKVVAIGSPLGLFNSVSNGIISGFRDLERVSMIQFTAPVSHGSSGGALLDMYGDLIGLITAGYDDGQNLNLAVDYKTISQFVRGLL